MTQGIDTPGTPGSVGLGQVPMGGAAPPEAGPMPSDAPKTEQVRDAASGVAATATGQAADVAATAADQTREVATAAKGAAGDVASTAMEKAAEVTSEATEQVRNLVAETTTQVRTQAEAQTTKVAEGIAGLSDQIRALLDGRPEEAEAIRDYLQQGATKLTALSDRLQSQGLEGTIAEVQRYARRRPGTFLLGALGVGFGVGRLVRGVQAASAAAPSGTGTMVGAPGATEVRGTLAVPGADGFERPVDDVVPPLPVNVPLPAEVAAISPLLADDPTVPIQTAPPMPGGGR